jgi:hypothetical protein
MYGNCVNRPCSRQRRHIKNYAGLSYVSLCYGKVRHRWKFDWLSFVNKRRSGFILPLEKLRDLAVSRQVNQCCVTAVLGV